MKIWSCKIGEIDEGKLPIGSDLPMRIAVREAYYRVTGEWPEFLFSGWSAELDDIEKQVVERQRAIEREINA